MHHSNHGAALSLWERRGRGMPKKIYAVRKRSGQWTVWTDDDVCLNFRSYDEAIATAQTAAVVLSHKPAETAEESIRPEASNRH